MHRKGTLNRRGFLQQSLGTGVTAGLAVSAGRKAVAANDRVVVGLMGCGGRGAHVTAQFAQRGDVRVKTVCDVNQNAFARVSKLVDTVTGRPPGQETDFRRMLEDPDIDILINATPDHWHGLGTILACQAGKHVYVEKPASHNIWEGRKMVEAARKYNRVVQVGTQSRSAPYVRHAVEEIRGGRLGKIHTVRVHQMVKSSLSLNHLPVVAVPETFDYDMYCGPAEKVPFRGGSTYLLLWNFSGGLIFADAVHQLDLARWLIGRRHPVTVHNAGGIYVDKDGRDCPDTHTTTFEYENDLLLVYQGSTASAGMEKIAQHIRTGDLFPDWLRCSTRVELFGTDGMMVFGRHGGGWQVFQTDGSVVKQEYGRPGDHEHIENFIDCIRSGKRPNADIEEGHISAAMGHLSNISFRLGNRSLRFDGAAENFPGEPEANALLKRAYRKPWVIPEQV